MKKLMIIALLLTSMSVQVQQKEVAEIRKLYAKAKADVALVSKSGQSEVGETEVTSWYTEPGVGPTKETLHYYFRTKEDEHLGVMYHSPFLITRKHNVGATEYYEEYLYNDCDQLAFYFEKTSQSEIRLYWDNCNGNDFFHKAVKGDSDIDENKVFFIQRYAADLHVAFSQMLNHNYD